MVAAEQASTSVTSRAVGNNFSAPSPGNRLSSLVEGFTGSVALRFNNLWGNPQPLISQTSNTEVSDTRIADRPVQLTGSTANIAEPQVQIPFRHRATKSTGSNTSITSQPVLVRTYSRIERARTASADPSIGGVPQSMTASTNLPSVDAFSFDGILRAIEPEINEAIDGIAEIYARSKLSLADEYGAHLPPQGEISTPRMRYSGLAIRTAGLERTLTTVTEASSSSEKLAGGSKAGSVASGKGKVTAYGSLRSIISRGRSSSHSSAPPETPIRSRLAPPAWSIAGDNEHFITIKRQNTAPMHLSLASVAEVPRDKTVPGPSESEGTDEPTSPTPRRPASWLGWRRSWTGVADEGIAPPRLDAEGALKSVLGNIGGLRNDVR